MEQDDGLPPMAAWKGKGGSALTSSPKDPQWWLAGSNHPYAPFVGNALKWHSYVYDDGTTYEGLMLNDIPHNKGVLVFGNGLGGGIQRAERGDRYEGEFDAGFASGMGQYTSTKGRVYRGEWTAGMRHGCGVEYDTTPFLKRVEAGQDADAAWAEAQPEIEGRKRLGTWLRDVYYTGPDSSSGWCALGEVKGTEQEVQSVVSTARMFEYKPDGEVTFRFAQDGNGMPAPVMQDPLHYPHGTKFLAPGPLGQCHPVPDVSSIKGAMKKAAELHARIFGSYNLPYDIQPGTIMAKAQKRWRKKEARKKRNLDRRLLREQQRIRRMETEAAALAGPSAAAASEDKGKKDKGKKDKKDSPKGKSPPKEEPPSEDEDEDDFNDDDLIASSAGVEQQQQGGGGATASGQQQQQRGFQPPTVLACASLGLSRAAVMVQRVFSAAALRAPPRRALTRPQRQ